MLEGGSVTLVFSVKGFNNKEKCQSIDRCFVYFLSVGGCSMAPFLPILKIFVYILI